MTNPASITTYDDAVRWLYDRIDYERIRPPEKINPFRLERITRLLERIGSPQQRIPAVHIAGTKGKGSTAAMLDSILRAANIRTGLFTSPHIEQFEERMRVSGRMPNPDQLTQLVARLHDILQNEPDLNDRIPTFFEVTTLLAWMFFDLEHVELVVLETGLGGRLDCTNVCNPLVTVITSIGLDHTHILGDTLTKIAAEKAGILKHGVPVVVGQLPGEAELVVTAEAERLACPRFVCGHDFAWQAERSAIGERPASAGRFPAAIGHALRSQSAFLATPTHSYANITIPLLGQHQLHNASLATMSAELLRDRGFPQIDERAIRNGLASTHWPLRFEVIDGSPVVILDAAHNPDSMHAVASVLREPEWQNRRRVLIFAASADKDARSMLSIIAPSFDHVILTRFLGNPRSIAPQQLLDLARSLALKEGPEFAVADDPSSALAAGRLSCGPSGVVCATGSLFLAAEIRGLLCRT